MGLVLQASLAVQLVLLVLALLSVISWTIIAFKWRELKRARQDSEAFLEVYQQGSLEASQQAARDLDRSPLSAIFLSAWAELNRIARFSGKAGAKRPLALTGANLQTLERHIHWTASREGLRLERGLGFLATTGSAAPFIGLFGTVIGIINAFHGIGRAGAASLAVVAPGIAEALIATAIGLFAAIPATVAYNHFLGALRGLAAAIDLFTTEYVGDLQRIADAQHEPPRAARV